MGLVSSFRRSSGSRIARMGLLCAVALAAMLGLGWLWMRPQPQAVMPAPPVSTGVDATPIQTVGISTRPRRDGVASALSRSAAPAQATADDGPPSPALPVDERIAQLEPLARAGRADAMLALGRALLDCRLVGSMGDDAIQQHWIDDLLVTQHKNPDVITDDALKTMVGDMTRRTIGLRNHCTGLADVNNDAWLDWIERAAQAGDTQAVQDYVIVAVDAKSLDGEDLAASPEDIARRKAQGSKHLWDALERGDCSVLSLIAAAYSGDTHERLATDIAPDASKAYSFLFAAHLWLSQIAPQDDVQWQSLLDEAVGMLGTIGRADAEAQGRAILRQYCTGTPRLTG